MIILSQVPYLPGDVHDANHIRVENHHSVGLTGSTVKIEALSGTMSTRYVRCVSRPDRPKWPRSIVVHLKPLQGAKKPRLHCRNLPTICILDYISANGNWPSYEEYAELARHYSSPSAFAANPIKPGSRLVLRKQTKILQQGMAFIDNEEEVASRIRVTLTAKGRQRLEQRRAGF